MAYFRLVYGDVWLIDCKLQHHVYSFSFLQYDAVPIQSSVVLCSCPSPSMVRNQADPSPSPVAAPCGSRQGLSMEGTTAEPRGSEKSLQQPPQPRKKRPEDFNFVKILGEGSFSTVSIYCNCGFWECHGRSQPFGLCVSFRQFPPPPT